MADSNGCAPDLLVLGLGYVGLPLAREAVSVGLNVLGFDSDPAVVDALDAGESPVSEVHDTEVQRMRRAGFRVVAVESELEPAPTAVICVPTPLSDGFGPDLRAVTAACRTVAGLLRPGMLVVLESTTYPGTTDEVVRPILEESGLMAGTEFALAFSPERIDPGNATFSLRNTPKVVGGHTDACAGRAAEFYRQLVDTVVRTRGTREAELAKLLENTYRHVNIALVNEMARFCHPLGVDLWDAIRAAATKPFGFQPFYPGPGVGGHCIPIDPSYLSHRVRATLGYPFRFVELAQEINATMPGYLAHRVQELLNEAGRPVNGATVLLLGVTFKPDVADARQSPAAPLARQLSALGAKLAFHDPHVPHWQPPEVDVLPVVDLNSAVAAADVVVLLQNHRCYDPVELAQGASLLLDTRGVVPTGTGHRL